jgi:hypothetical protein
MSDEPLACILCHATAEDGVEICQLCRLCEDCHDHAMEVEPIRQEEAKK